LESHLPGSKKILDRFSDDRRHGRSTEPIDGDERIAGGGEISVEKASRARNAVLSGGV
jgi:hypothetical protein